MSATFALMVSILVSTGTAKGSPLQLEPQVRKGFVTKHNGNLISITFIASAREMQSNFSQVNFFYIRCLWEKRLTFTKKMFIFH